MLTLFMCGTSFLSLCLNVNVVCYFSLVLVPIQDLHWSASLLHVRRENRLHPLYSATSRTGPHFRSISMKGGGDFPWASFPHELVRSCSMWSLLKIVDPWCGGSGGLGGGGVGGGSLLQGDAHYDAASLTSRQSSGIMKACLGNLPPFFPNVSAVRVAMQQTVLLYRFYRPPFCSS